MKLPLEHRMASPAVARIHSAFLTYEWKIPDLATFLPPNSFVQLRD